MPFTRIRHSLKTGLEFFHLSEATSYNSPIRNRQATEKIEIIVVSKIKSSFVSNTLKIVLKYSCWSIYSVYVNFIVIGDTDNYLEKKQR